MSEEVPLFDSRERLAELEQERARLLEELAEIAAEQKRVGARIRQLEKGQRAALENVTEYVAQEPLRHEDIERWVRSVFWQWARTMPDNPHMYAHVRWCDEAMFRRVIRHIRQHGYRQVYGGSAYRTYDVAGSFIWLNSGPGGYENPKPVDEYILINRKPNTLRPE